MIYQFLDFFTHTALIIALINVGMMFLFYQNVKEELHGLMLYLLSYSVISVWSFILFEKGANNLPLLHLYTLLEFITLSLFYKKVLRNKPFFGKDFTIFMGVVVLLLILNSIFFESFYNFNSNAKAVVQIILIGYSIYFFFTTFGKIDFSKRKNQALLLINFAILLYYSGSLFIFMFMKTLIKMQVLQEDTMGFWVFHSVLLLIFQILVLIAVVKAAFPKKELDA